MNTAEVYEFPLKQEQPRVADLDDGYTKLANELLESLSCCNLTARQFRVMLALIRKTYGFGKKNDRIADSQLSEITGLSRQNVNKAKNELISMNYIVKDGNKIGVNKEVSAWKNQLRDTVSNLETKKVSKLETNDVSGLETHKRNTLKKKENIYTPISPKPEKPAKPEPFDANAHPLPDWLSRDTWVNWVTYRKDLKKPIRTKQTLNGLISRLTKFYEAGYTPESVIDESISNGWTGLFMPKSPPTRSRIVRPKRVQQFIPEDF